MLEINKIHLGDSYKLIKEIPDKSVDLVIIDPPLFKRIRDLILLKKRTKLTKKQQGKFDKELPF